MQCTAKGVLGHWGYDFATHVMEGKGTKSKNRTIVCMGTKGHLCACMCEWGVPGMHWGVVPKASTGNCTLGHGRACIASFRHSQTTETIMHQQYTRAKPSKNTTKTSKHTTTKKRNTKQLPSLVPTCNKQNGININTVKTTTKQESNTQKTSYKNT